MTNDLKKINFFTFILQKENNTFVKFSVFEDMLYVNSKYHQDAIEVFDIQAKLSDENKSLLIDTINQLQLKQWKKKYLNYKIKNGKYWELNILYNDLKTPKTYVGLNEYPIVYSDKGALRPFSSTSYTPEFKILLKNLNKIAGKRSLFK